MLTANKDNSGRGRNYFTFLLNSELNLKKKNMQTSATTAKTPLNIK